MINQFQNTGVLGTYDWSRVRKFFDQILEKIDQNKIDSLKYREPNWNGDIYAFDGHGALVRGVYQKGNWDVWTGELLEKSIPWSKEIMRRLQSLDIGFQNFSFGRHSFELDAHIDYPSDGQKLDGSCNLNFIIKSEDPNGYTYVDHEGQRYTHPSIAGTAWLLDTSVMHGVVNNALREVFQIRFYKPFDLVNDALSKNPDILVI